MECTKIWWNFGAVVRKTHGQTQLGENELRSGIITVAIKSEYENVLSPPAGGMHLASKRKREFQLGAKRKRKTKKEKGKRKTKKEKGKRKTKTRAHLGVKRNEKHFGSKVAISLRNLKGIGRKKEILFYPKVFSFNDSPPQRFLSQ